MCVRPRDTVTRGTGLIYEHSEGVAVRWMTPRELDHHKPTGASKHDERLMVRKGEGKLVRVRRGEAEMEWGRRRGDEREGGGGGGRGRETNGQDGRGWE